MRELTRLAPVRRRALIIVACGLVLAGCSGGKTVSPAPQTVEGKVPTAPQVKGDPAAGKKIFASAGCAGCHTLKDAGATGAIGPAFDDLQPGPDQIIAALRSGIGAMPSYRGNLSDEQMRALARYVSKASGGAK